VHSVQVALQATAGGSTESLSAASMRLMTPVAAAWTAQGFPEQELIDMAVTGSKSMPEASRAALLQSLSVSLPSVSVISDWLMFLTVMVHSAY